MLTLAPIVSWCKMLSILTAVLTNSILFTSSKFLQRLKTNTLWMQLYDNRNKFIFSNSQWHRGNISTPKKKNMRKKELAIEKANANWNPAEDFPLLHVSHVELVIKSSVLQWVCEALHENPAALSTQGCCKVKSINFTWSLPQPVFLTLGLPTSWHLQWNIGF